MWLHFVEGAVFGEADVLQGLAGGVVVRAHLFGVVAVASDGDDFAAEGVVEFQDFDGRCESRDAVADGRVVDFDAFAVFDDRFQDIGDDFFVVGECVRLDVDVAADEVHVRQDAVVFVVFDQIFQLFIVALVNFVVGFSFLEFVEMEFLVVDLVD